MVSNYKKQGEEDYGDGDGDDGAQWRMQNEVLGWKRWRWEKWGLFFFFYMVKDNLRILKYYLETREVYKILKSKREQVYFQ